MVKTVALLVLCAVPGLCGGPLATTMMGNGSSLEVRLSTSVGSRISHPGDPVEAVVIAPVASGEDLYLLQGASLSGSVETVHAVGFGLKRGAADLDIHFHTIQLRDGSSFPIRARICRVETAREHVDLNGRVLGINPAASVSTGLSFMMSTVLVHSELEAPAFAIKLLAAKSPDYEIYFPRGTEMFLQLTSDLVLDASHALRGSTPLPSLREISTVNRVLGTLPMQQAELPPHHSSDLINVLLLGTKDQVDKAFRFAGWSGESGHSAVALYRMFNCLIQRMGYAMAPMTRLTLNGLPQTRAYQKSLDTLSKRHHVRFWRQANTDMWLGAASEDVGLAVRRMRLTHAIDRHIDDERAKIVNDLWFAGCVQEAVLLPRPGLKTAAREDFAITTDGSLAVLRLRDCDPARKFPSPDPMTVRTRLSKTFYDFGRDLLRANPLTVAVTMARTMSGMMRKGPAAEMLDARRPERPITVDTYPTEMAVSGTVAPRIQPMAFRCPVADHTN